MTRPPPRSTLFLYTTLFRSSAGLAADAARDSGPVPASRGVAEGSGAVCGCFGQRGCLTVLGGSGASSIPVLRGVVRSAWFATRSTPQRSDRQRDPKSIKHAEIGRAHV